MKTPTWAIVIGICLILFGGCTASSSLQSIKMPQALEMQKEFIENLSKSKTTSKSDSLGVSQVDSLYSKNAEAFKVMADTFGKAFEVSEFTKTWTVRFGYIGLFLALLYIVSGIFLLMKKPFSINLVFGVLGLGILIGITQTIVLVSDSSGGFMALTSGLSKIFWVVVNIVLVVVVLVVDKSVYGYNK